MAEQETRNALTPGTGTPDKETFAAAEHPHPTGKPSHHSQEINGAENGSAKYASSHKKATGEDIAHATQETDGANGAHDASAGVNGTENSANDEKGTNGAREGAHVVGGTEKRAASRKTRARKKAAVDPAAPPDVFTAAGGTVPSRKRAASRKAPSSKRRKTAQVVKQEEAGAQDTQASAAAEAALALPPTSIHADMETAGGEVAPFEPDLEPTPVKAREMPPLSLAALEAELDALLSELAQEEPPSELEDTMRRPAVSGMPPTSTVETLYDIPETPMIAAPELAKAPETPLPALDEKEAPAEAALPAEDEEVWETLVAEEEIEATVIAVIETRPVVEPVQPAPPAVAAPSEARPRRLRLPLKRVAMLLALCLCLASALLLWQNAGETHLYLYHFDPANGQLLAQQDLGGYAGISALSNAAQDSSSLFVGVSSAPSAQEQVLALAGSDTSWHVTREFAAAPGRSTLSVGPGHVLAVEDGSGLLVLASDGRVLWQVAGDAPLLGTHPFTPAFNGSTAYTITSARRGMVGAYDAHSGAPRWSVQLDDTLNYAPPVLLAGDTLYVAGDHTLYALNAITGGTHWKIAMPARTLLYSQAGSPALITAGPSGLAAFDPQTGNLLWAFNGQPDTNGETDTMTPAQFYQASLANDGTMVYATGVAWDTQRLQQQLWLFAVDAGSGKVAWSEPIGTGFTSADAGRVFAPFIDTAHKLIVIEQARSSGEHTLSAFDTGDGFQRWNVRLAAVSASAPALVQVAGGSLGVFSAQNDAGLALRIASGPRLLLVLAIASFLALLLLWLVPLSGWLRSSRRRLRRLPQMVLALLRAPRRLWNFSRLLFAVTLAAVLIGAGLLTYTQLNRQQPYVRQVGGENGSALWQHLASPATTLAGVDDSGALLVSGAADHTFELNALDSHGSPLWTLSSGEGTFAIPGVATRAGTVLAVLRGPSALPYRYAADDPAYPHPLAHYFALYLLDSHTGAVRWHTALAGTGAFQDFSVLGADAQFIYIAAQAFEQQQVTQLMAVDKMDGVIAWRFYGPGEQAGSAADPGAILAQGNLVYWQVGGAVFALNPQSGQVEWRDAIPEVNARMASLEDGQMAAGQGVLLIRRSDMYHALDLVTGAERWTLSGLGVDSAQAPGGILADGNRFILYGGGSIEAFDPAIQSILWKHSNLAAVSNVSLSPDGSMVYAVVLNSTVDGTTAQALVAFDTNSDLIRWTFQPGAQAQFVYAGTRIIYNAGGMIYLATCVAGGPGPCIRQVLYGVDEQTGQARWQVQARRIYALQAGQNGQTLTFQTESSAWESLKQNLKALFRG